jgi:hypothetical protein
MIKNSSVSAYSYNMPSNQNNTAGRFSISYPLLAQGPGSGGLSLSDKFDITTGAIGFSLTAPSSLAIKIDPSLLKEAEFNATGIPAFGKGLGVVGLALSFYEAIDQGFQMHNVLDLGIGGIMLFSGVGEVVGGGYFLLSLYTYIAYGESPTMLFQEGYNGWKNVAGSNGTWGLEQLFQGEVNFYKDQ